MMLLKKDKKLTKVHAKGLLAVPACVEDFAVSPVVVVVVVVVVQSVESVAVCPVVVVLSVEGVAASHVVVVVSVEGVAASPVMVVPLSVVEGDAASPVMVVPLSVEGVAVVVFPVGGMIMISYEFYDDNYSQLPLKGRP